MKQIAGLALLLLVARPIYADASSPFPGLKTAHAIQRIETQEEHPGYVFLILKSGYRLNEANKQSEEFEEAEYVDPRPDHAIEIRLTGATNANEANSVTARENAQLLVIPREAATAYASASELWKAIKQGKVRTVSSKWFDYRETVPSWASNEITIAYRIQKTASGDGLEIVRTSSDPLRQWKAAAIFLAASVVIGGVWFIRRAIWPRSPQTPTKTT